ncbi:hypothetical protein JW968_01530 [Candidatus Woesearchaeota archaeon]|nr:hypothetical protein [Candidatus Woesearchaeota archaeon]
MVIAKKSGRSASEPIELPEYFAYLMGLQRNLRKALVLGSDSPYTRSILKNGLSSALTAVGKELNHASSRSVMSREEWDAAEKKAYSIDVRVDGLYSFHQDLIRYRSNFGRIGRTSAADCAAGLMDTVTHVVNIEDYIMRLLDDPSKPFYTYGYIMDNVHPDIDPDLFSGVRHDPLMLNVLFFLQNSETVRPQPNDQPPKVYPHGVNDGWGCPEEWDAFRYMLVAGRNAEDDTKLTQDEFSGLLNRMKSMDLIRTMHKSRLEIHKNYRKDI